MQFLFVILMSVVMGAFSLPHLLSSKSVTAFSARKEGSTSLVKLPPFTSKLVAEKKPVEAIVEDKKEVVALPVTEASDPNKEVAAEVKLEEAEEKKKEEQASSASSDDEFKRELANYKGPEGSMMLDEVDLKSCVCQGDKSMQCKLWVDGSCSDVDEYVSVLARGPASSEFRKNFRCKDDNRFSGFLTVYGDQTIRMQVMFRDKIYKKDFSLTNHCGSLSGLKSSEDE